MRGYRVERACGLGTAYEVSLCNARIVAQSYDPRFAQDGANPHFAPNYVDVVTV